MILIVLIFLGGWLGGRCEDGFIGLYLDCSAMWQKSSEFSLLGALLSCSRARTRAFDTLRSVPLEAWSFAVVWRYYNRAFHHVPRCAPGRQSPSATPNKSLPRYLTTVQKAALVRELALEKSGSRKASRSGKIAGTEDEDDGASFFCR